MERFVLQQSERQGWLVCTDTLNNIVCSFKEHRFNETQETTLLGDIPPERFMEVAAAMREMGDWLRKNHYEKIF